VRLDSEERWELVHGAFRRLGGWLYIATSISAERLYLIDEVGSYMAPKDVGFERIISSESYLFTVDYGYFLPFEVREVVYSIGGKPTVKWKQKERAVKEVVFPTIKV